MGCLLVGELGWVLRRLRRENRDVESDGMDLLQGWELKNESPVFKSFDLGGGGGGWRGKSQKQDDLGCLLHARSWVY